MHFRFVMEGGLLDTQHLLLACLNDKAETIFVDDSTRVDTTRSIFTDELG